MKPWGCHAGPISFYYRAIRTKLGDAPRTQYDMKEPLPDAPIRALFELYEQERFAASGTGNPRSRAQNA
jgi:hypothetical protein